MSRRRTSYLVGFVALGALAFVAKPALAQGDAVVPPQVVKSPEAVYPSAVKDKANADVVLIVTVEKDGNVNDAAVDTSGGKEFDDAALAAVKAWQFTPAKHNGEAIRARIKVAFHFTPPGAAPPAQPGATPPAPPTPNAPNGAVPQPGAPPSPPANEATGAQEPAPLTADEVTIVGHAIAPSRGASDFHIDVGELARVPRKTASELLTLAPGVLLTNEGGEGHAEQVFLRGFDAREGQDLEFTVDGVPINESGNLHGNGYADTHFILPELVQTLRVVEGPFDPSQGNYAVAGSAEYELGLAERGLTTKYTIGSFNSHRLLVLWGPAEESTRTFGGAEIATTDGYGQNRDAKRATAMGQYEGKIGGSALFRITGTAYATQYHSAGVLREDDYEAGRVGFYDTYDPNQGGSSSRYAIAASVESHAGSTVLSQQVFAILRDMRLRENFTGFLLDPQEPLQDPHPQRGDLIDLNMNETTIGARGSARLSADALGQKQELELGYFARGDRVTGSQSRIEASTGHPYHIDRDLTSSLGDIGLFVDADAHPTSWLTIRGGVRADLFAFDVTNNCAVQTASHPPAPVGDASCLSQEDFGAHREPFQRASTASVAVLPRASVVLGPVRHFRWSASVGRGVRSVDPSYVTQDTAAPFASILSYEGGVTYLRSFESFTLAARSLVFQTKVDKDLIFSETEGRNVLGGGSTRTGWVGAVRATSDHVDVSTNVTLVKSTLDDTHLLVPYVPDAVVRTDATVFGALPWKAFGEAFRASLSSGATFVGHRPLPFGQRSDTVFTLDAGATLGISHYEIGVTASNLFDAQVRLGEFNFASDFPTDGRAAPTLVPVRHFAAGPPRQIFATFAVNLGGTK